MKLVLFSYHSEGHVFLGLDGLALDATRTNTKVMLTLYDIMLIFKFLSRMIDSISMDVLIQIYQSFVKHSRVLHNVKQEPNGGRFQKSPFTSGSILVCDTRFSIPNC